MVTELQYAKCPQAHIALRSFHYFSSSFVITSVAGSETEQHSNLKTISVFAWAMRYRPLSFLSHSIKDEGKRIFPLASAMLCYHVVIMM